MNELRVTHYDEKEVLAKKQLIIERLSLLSKSKRVVAVGGVAAITLFSLTGFISCGGAGAWYQSCPEDCPDSCDCPDNCLEGCCDVTEEIKNE